MGFAKSSRNGILLAVSEMLPTDLDFVEKVILKQKWFANNRGFQFLTVQFYLLTRGLIPLSLLFANQFCLSIKVPNGRNCKPKLRPRGTLYTANILNCLIGNL
jgi:hypothetical protein